MNKSIYEAAVGDEHVEMMDVVRESRFEDPRTPELDDWMYEIRYKNECVETMIGKDGRKLKKDPRIKVVPYSRLKPKNEEKILGEVTNLIFGSKRSLLRSAFTRWYLHEKPSEAFNSKISICNAPGESGNKLRRRMKRHIFDKEEDGIKKGKKGIDILKELKLKTPMGWDDTEARKMFWSIYVSWPANNLGGHRQSAETVEKASTIDHTIRRTLLPRYQMWQERKEGALALKKELMTTMTKQTSLLNSRMPGSGNNFDDDSLTLKDLYENDETESNMEELSLEVDRVAKEREYWRQKVIEYQVQLDKMVSQENGKSIHEFVADDGRQQSLHQNVSKGGMTWELQ